MPVFRRTARARRVCSPWVDGLQCCLPAWTPGGYQQQLLCRDDQLLQLILCVPDVSLTKASVPGRLRKTVVSPASPPLMPALFPDLPSASCCAVYVLLAASAAGRQTQGLTATPLPEPPALQEMTPSGHPVARDLSCLAAEADLLSLGVPTGADAALPQVLHLPLQLPVASLSAFQTPHRLGTLLLQL